MAKKKSKQTNMYFVIGMILLSGIIVVLFVINMMTILGKGGSGSGTTVGVDRNSSMKNDLYIIGNNPTELSIDYFKDLTSSLKGDDPTEIAANVVRCFISDYYTWTNKDGNYEVGGLQYIYGSGYVMYEVESKWTFYSDLDLYISQYGRENLLEVSDVEIITAVDGGNFEAEGIYWKSYYVEAKWKYKNSKAIDVNEFQNVGYFTVVDREGRYEIVQFFESYE